MSESLGNHYVLGFIFDKNFEHVVIQTKNHPHFLAGMKNGLGGKISPEEAPVEAISREVMEEGGVMIPVSEWNDVGRIADSHFDILVFSAVLDDLGLVIAQEDEPLEIMTINDALQCEVMAPHVDECIATALARYARQPVV